MKKVLFLALFLAFGAVSYGQQIINEMHDFGQCIVFADTSTTFATVYPKSDIKLRYRKNIDLTIYSVSSGNVVARFLASNASSVLGAPAGNLEELFFVFGSWLTYTNTDKTMFIHE